MHSLRWELLARETGVRGMHGYPLKLLLVVMPLDLVRGGGRLLKHTPFAMNYISVVGSFTFMYIHDYPFISVISIHR